MLTRLQPGSAERDVLVLPPLLLHSRKGVVNGVQ